MRALPVRQEQPVGWLMPPVKFCQRWVNISKRPKTDKATCSLSGTMMRRKAVTTTNDGTRSANQFFWGPHGSDSSTANTVFEPRLTLWLPRQLPRRAQTTRSDLTRFLGITAYRTRARQLLLIQKFKRHFAVHGSRFTVLGSRFTLYSVHGVWFTEYTTQFAVHSVPLHSWRNRETLVVVHRFCTFCSAKL